MANPLRDFFLGHATPRRELLEAVVPQRTFDDVILPPATRRQLDHALIQIRKRDLIFHQWGLAERHSTGMGLAFNFAGPPGTGKTICAEAIAHELGKKLLVVRYSEMESLWAGETGKNVTAVFRTAREQDCVLFFDEADAIAGRRFTAVTQGYQREANTVVNVLLKELESFDGVIIFATNLAVNFDPAFERRVRTHILFEMPGVEERARIWRVQLHERKTPLAEDVDFTALARAWEVSGGEIKNAVLKAAQMATAEAGPDHAKQIHQRHFEAGMREVLAAKKVMEQTLFEGDGSHALTAMGSAFNGALDDLNRRQEGQGAALQVVTQQVEELKAATAALPALVERFDEGAHSALRQLRTELQEGLRAVEAHLAELRQSSAAQWHQTAASTEALRGELEQRLASNEQSQLDAQRAAWLRTESHYRSVLYGTVGAGLLAAAALVAALFK